MLLWELAVDTGTEALCVSLAIVVPKKKVFIQNLQIRRPGRESICFWCFFRRQDRHSGLERSGALFRVADPGSSHCWGCSCQTTLTYMASGILGAGFCLFPISRRAKLLRIKQQKFDHIEVALSLQDGL